MKKLVICLFILAALSLALGLQLSSASAQTGTEPLPGILTVVTMQLEPFVILQVDGSLTGFSVELWDALAEDLGLRYRWVPRVTVTQQIAAVQNDQADLAISAISMTPERERLIDFSHPYFDAGLGILIANQQNSSMIQIFQGIFTPELLKVLGIALVCLILMAHVIWLVERGSKHEISRAYLPGIWEAFWWAFNTIVLFEYGDRERTLSPWKRILAMSLVVVGIVLIAQFTATITASLTVQQLTSIIQGPEDLPGARIVTVDGSTAALYLEREGLEFLAVERIEEAYEILEAGDADAIVFDSPVLLNYVKTRGKGRVEIAGPTFEEESYAITLPVDSELREPINQALLRLKKNGVYDRIYETWFGELK